MKTVRRPRLRDRLEARPVLVALVSLHVLMKLLLLPKALGTRIQGDEITYNDGAMTIATTIRGLFHGVAPSAAAFNAHLIGDGWFMPGMSLVVSPLYLVDPSAGVHAVRLYMGAVTLVVFLLGVLLVSRVMGRRYAAVLLVIPGLIPMWVLYSYTTWGDLSAGLLVILLVTHLVHLWKRVDAGAGVPLGHGLLLGLLLAITLYLRSSALPVVAGLLGLAVLAVLFRTRGPERVRSLVACVLAAVVFAVLLLPWSYAASRSLDHRVVTTTTVPLSMAYTFGHRDQLCFGPCRPGNVWFESARYSAVVAQETHTNWLVVQKQSSDYALRDLTASSYARQVYNDLGRYVLEPSGFEPAFRVVGSQPSTVSHLVIWSSDVLYFAALVIAALVALVGRRLPRTSQVVVLLASLLTAALMTQPFVHVCTPRYWPVFAPLLGLAVGSLTVRAAPQASSRWLWRFHTLVAAGWVVVLGGLLLIAA